MKKTNSSVACSPWRLSSAASKLDRMAPHVLMARHDQKVHPRVRKALLRVVPTAAPVALLADPAAQAADSSAPSTPIATANSPRLKSSAPERRY